MTEELLDKGKGQKFGDEDLYAKQTSSIPSLKANYGLKIYAKGNTWIKK